MEKYILVNMDSGTLEFTNSQDEATKYSMCDDFFVIVTAKIPCLSDVDSNSLKTLDDLYSAMGDI